MKDKESITGLQKRINALQRENHFLRDVLNRHNIPFEDELDIFLNGNESTAFEEDQGARIIHPKHITRDMANRFYARFWGRTDVYAKRSVSKKTGKAGYYPQCDNFWTNVCPRKTGDKIKCSECKHKKYTELKIEAILSHLNGVKADGSDVIGVYPLMKNGTCRFLVFDFDNHDLGSEEIDFANTDEKWQGEVNALRRICEMNGIDPLVECSRSGKGAHVWIFFDKPVPATVARNFGFALLEKGAENVNLKSFKYYDRILPAQDTLDDGKIGNLIALPLQKLALSEGNSAFIDENWNAYPDQWRTLESKPSLSQEFLEAKIGEWSGVFKYDKKQDETGKPWEKDVRFLSSDAPGGIKMVLSDGIYVETNGLKPSLLNKIRRFAAFRNPTYYKKQAIGLSNLGNGSWIYLGEDVEGYVHVPIGCLETICNKCAESNLSIEIEDNRTAGRNIRVEFKGELRPEQKTALDVMKGYESGILRAATAFGKTVVCSAMISEKKVNTLILLESSSLIDQWIDTFKKFLAIDEELPEYKTKTGRVKRRKSVIGRLQGAHDSTTGIIDIAMVGSFYKKGRFHSIQLYSKGKS